MAISFVILLLWDKHKSIPQITSPLFLEKFGIPAGEEYTSPKAREKQ
jgi:hypothetical protein